MSDCLSCGPLTLLEMTKFMKGFSAAITVCFTANNLWGKKAQYAKFMVCEQEGTGFGPQRVHKAPFGGEPFTSV